MCTGIRFTDANGAMYFGRNLDWTQGYGERVVMTPPAARVPAAFERTLYTSCFSAASLTYYHAAYDDLAIKAYPLSGCDLAGTEPVLVEAAA